MDIRELLITNINKEIIGPNPHPAYSDPKTGEERLLKYVHGSPSQRYGAGILYPMNAVNIGVVNPSEQEALNDLPIEEGDAQNIDDDIAINNSDAGDIEEEPITLANQYYPSAMGLTVRFNRKLLSNELKATIKCAKYIKGEGKLPVKFFNNDTNSSEIKVNKNNEQILSEYWTRIPIVIEPIILKIVDKLNASNKCIFSETYNDIIKFQVFNRTTSDDEVLDYCSLTFVIINNTSEDKPTVDNMLFQCSFSIETETENLIVPYKEKDSFNDTDEEKEMNLLYSDKRTFAIGHGCSVHWHSIFREGEEKVKNIQTSTIPVFDMPQIAPTNYVELSMFELSDLGNWESSLSSLHKLCIDYEKWIDSLKLEVEKEKNKSYYEAIKKNIDKCIVTLNRIKNGYQILVENDPKSNIVKAFRWMNRAMIWQQQRSKANISNWEITRKNNQQFITLPNPNIFVSLEEYSKQNNGKWRPFQIAFVLMNLASIIDGKSPEREIVDLIWFPTGGGKTEAYLGLSAFTIFFRRLLGSSNWDWEQFGGTSIIMRYTLRLLTTQQYERAASLISACELIRKENYEILGDEEISIGLWVGGTSTPNSNDDARSQYNALNNLNINGAYNFVVMKCPCCGTQIGKVSKGVSKGLKKMDGNNGKVLFFCENIHCEFYDIQLPLQVVDDYIYENPPTLLLATVDKFSMIPWKVDAGKIFGFRFSDRNICTKRIKPPELIIQDELHLISGPLGTMVGLFETMVQTLCNNYSKNTPPFIALNDTFSPPKIIASSATISRAYEQVHSLYGIDNRNKLNIFPSQGLKFGDTWFSKERNLDIEENIINYPSRKYVGILASGYPSAQTSIVRAYASVLQTIGENKTERKTDFYWTLIGYFNSIRELGGARSLLAGDIIERLGQIQNMNLVEKNKKRYLNLIKELTSQISSSEIPKNLKEIEKSFSLENNKAIDVCLATNMLATGVDISRLGLMFIHGQPKTSAEYIQASSRVGRSVPNGPGIIFTLYNPSKPRDKSQYEQFQSYHSRIYANVEPTSVTPFSINARHKALHSVAVGLIRHFAVDSLRYFPIVQNQKSFSESFNIISDIIKKRVTIIDRRELAQVDNNLIYIYNFWLKGFQYYGDAYNRKANEGIVPLLYSPNAEIPEHILINKSSLPTPTSMRGVDSESHIRII